MRILSVTTLTSPGRTPHQSPDPGGGRRWHASMRPMWGGELPVPAIIRRGRSRGSIAALVAGAILGGVSVVPPVLLSRQAAFVLLAVLGMIGSVYRGFCTHGWTGRDPQDRVRGAGHLRRLRAPVFHVGAAGLAESLDVLLIGAGQWRRKSARGGRPVWRRPPRASCCQAGFSQDRSGPNKATFSAPVSPGREKTS